MLRRSLIAALACLGMIAVGAALPSISKPELAYAAPDVIVNATCPGGIASQPVVVPGSVTLMTVTVRGAAGENSTTGVGGAGATATASFFVSPGQTFYFDIGCRGATTTGGFPSGGAGGAGGPAGGAGGGGSYLRSAACPTVLANVPCVDGNTLLVAGGGGGAGGRNSGGNGGGHDSSTTGLDGGPGTAGSAGGGGGGGSEFGPGSGGTGGGLPGFDGDTGPIGKGGLGGAGTAGGGGGGGGGGGCHGGGGGGSGDESPGGGGGGGGNCADLSAFNVAYGSHGGVNGSALVQFIAVPTLTKTFNPTTIAADQPSLMSFVLTNTNTTSATSVSFADDLAFDYMRVANPANFTTDCSGGFAFGNTPDDSFFGISNITLQPQGNPASSCTISMYITSSVVGVRTNTTSPVSSYEAGTGNIGASATLTVTGPDMVVTKTAGAATPGTPFNWTFRFTNQGNAPAVFPNGTLIFHDALPNDAGISYPTPIVITQAGNFSGGIICTLVALTMDCTTSAITTFNPGGYLEFTLQSISTNPGSFNNPRLGGTCTIDPNNVLTEGNAGGTGEANNDCAGTAVVTDTTDLTISMTASAPSFEPGQTGATYNIVVANGVVPAIGAARPAKAADPKKATVGQVSVVTTLPAGLTATAIAGTGWTCDLPSLTCTRSDSIDVGIAYPPIMVTVNVANPAPASVTTTATVSNASEPVANRGNNTASVTTPVTDTSDITISMTASAASFTQGQTGASYNIVVANGVQTATANTRPATAANPKKVTVGQVSVVVTLPAGLTATAIAGTGRTCDLPTLTCTRSDSIDVGIAYPPILVTVNVAGSAPASVTVTATVSNASEPLANRGNNTASVTTPVAALAADVTIAKSTTAGTLNPGSNVTYTLLVTNKGPGPATNVVVSDPIPPNTTFVSAVSSDPSFTIAQPAVGAGPPAVVTFTAPVLANGASATFTITVRVSLTAPAGSVVNVATVTANTPDPVVSNNSASASAVVGIPTPTPTPTATPSPFIPPVIPQIFQNPAAQGIFAPGNRATPTPQRAVAPAVVLPPSNSNIAPIVLRPPSTGDAGLWRLPRVW